MSPDRWQLDRRPVRQVVRSERAAPDPRRWPANVPAVAQLLREDLELPAGVTFLVGENGSGKSTLVEAIAGAYGLDPEGGSPYTRHLTRESESPLHSWIDLVRGAGAPRWGFFLRAETMHGLYTHLEGLGLPDHMPVLHEMSHGESFLRVLQVYVDSPGFYCLDEPEAALSFSSVLALMGTLHDLARNGGQILCATHSPQLASLPGATILEVGEWGLRESAWEDLVLVQNWRSYLIEPARYLRHVID
ncbi:MAG: AAA family ATPase [Propionibacteriaceae bacterium]